MDTSTRNETPIHIDTLTEQLAMLIKALNTITNNNTKKVKSTIIDLSEDVLTITQSTTVSLGDYQFDKQTIEKFVGYLALFKRGYSVPLEFNHKSLKPIQEWVQELVGEERKLTILLPDGLSFELDARIEDALETDQTKVSSVVGMLQQDSADNNFYIYSNVTDSKIACKIPETLQGQANEALGKQVEVYGRISYRHEQPYNVFVREIKIYPPNKDLFQLGDLWGIAKPASLGDLSSEEFVRKIRNEWE